MKYEEVEKRVRTLLGRMTENFGSKYLEEESSTDLQEAAQELAALVPPMRKYNVHVYHLVRSRVNGVEAKDMEQACEKAWDLHWHELQGFIGHQPTPESGDWDDAPDGVCYTEDAEEVHGYLVDIVGDENYEHSVYYERNEDGEFEVTEMKSYDQRKRDSE